MRRHISTPFLPSLRSSLSISARVFIYDFCPSLSPCRRTAPIGIRSFAIIINFMLFMGRSCVEYPSVSESTRNKNNLSPQAPSFWVQWARMHPEKSSVGVSNQKNLRLEYKFNLANLSLAVF